MAEANYLVNPETGSRFRLAGLRPLHEPSSLPKFSKQRACSDKDLPPSVDLRECMTDVEDQGKLGSCTGNALAAAYEFLIMKNTKKCVDVSRLFIYYNGRLNDGIHEYSMHDSGTYIRSAVAALREFGCCKESLFPHTTANVNRKPPPECYAEAKKYRITDGMQVNNDLNEMRACLAEGYPFAFTIELFQSFYEAETNGGSVKTPDPNESQLEGHGLHSMLAVGYSNRSESFIVKNSWGEKWGDHGYCYIPYEYMCNPERCTDMHAIKTVSNDDANRRREHQSAPNPYDWFKHGNRHFSIIPPNFPDESFSNTWFWKMSDPHDFRHQMEKTSSASFLVVQKFSSSHTSQHGYIEKVSKSKMSANNATTYILWIDARASENVQRAEPIVSKSSVKIKIDFQETMSKAEDHLLRHREKIQSPSSQFQIICRGFYSSENKNALNLIQFLNKHQLTHIPIHVYTQDKQGVFDNMQQKAPSMGINDWKRRVYIVGDPAELSQNIRKKMNN